MIKPFIPSNDNDRLESLYTYYVAGEEENEALNEIVQLTAEICNVPISMVTLIVKHEQIHKAKVGIDVTKIDRNHSFCAHSIQSPEDLLIIKDARQDDRFKKNPLVTGDPNIVFYAGKPIINSEGHFMGSLCVIDREPRELESFQLKAIEGLGRQAKRIFDDSKSFTLLKEKERLLKEALLLDAKEITQKLGNQMSAIDKTLAILSTNLPTKTVNYY